mgnify:CR=1 FL=1|jgi:type I restriction enzyme S subunit
MERNNKFLEKYPEQKLLELIEVIDERGRATKAEQIEGVNIEKDFARSVANLENSNLSKYKTVPVNAFACNLMHVGRDITVPVAFNSMVNYRIVSPAYTVFKVKDEGKLLPLFLFTQLNSKEFDRKLWFNTDGSVRGNLSWEDMCRVKIPLPPIEVQRAYVKAYQGLSTLIEQNEALVKELEKTAQACIVECREKWPMVEIGSYISTFERKNSNGCDYPFMGINKEKEIVPTMANTEDVNPRKYLILEKGELVFSGMQTGRDICIRIALSKFDSPILLSPAYTTFTVDEEKGIISEYLFLNFKSNEMDRLGWFKSDSSVRANLDWERFCEIKIPLPPIEVQRAIVALYTCAEEARKIAAEARELLKKACPAMVQSAAHYKVGAFR